MESLDIQTTELQNFNIALKGLVKNKTLSHLDLTDCKMSVKCLEVLAEIITAHPKLKILKINYNDFTRGGGSYESAFFNFCLSIHHNKTLEELHMNQTVISNAEIFWSAIGSNVALRYLRVKPSHD